MDTVITFGQCVQYEVIYYYSVSIFSVEAKPVWLRIKSFTCSTWRKISSVNINVGPRLVCKFETLALDATCGLTRVLQHCDLLRAVGAQEQLGASGGGGAGGAGGGGDHVAEHGRRRHHVIPLEHRQGGEALVHDVG